VLGEPARVDTVVQRGGNYARLWHHLPDLGRPLPWLRRPDGKFDLERWDEAYWSRLHELIGYAHSRGVVVSVPLWSQPGLEAGASGRWPGHPFHPVNNVNALGLPARDGIPEFFDTANGMLIAVQERYVERLVAELCAYGNVIFEITNEYTGPAAWEHRWISRVSRLCPAAPIAQNRLPGPSRSYWTDPDLDQVNYHNLRAEETFETFSHRYRYAKVQLYDEQALGPQSEANIRQMAWGALLGGGGINWDQSGNPAVTPGTSRALAAFLAGSGLDFLRARPDRSRLSHGFGMVRGTDEMAAYLPAGGSVVVDLSGWPGTYALRWFNPRTGAFNRPYEVMGGGKRVLVAPAPGDHALHLVRPRGPRPAIRGDGLDGAGVAPSRDALIILCVVGLGALSALGVAGSSRRARN
jgi:hypothetical protein